MPALNASIIFYRNQYVVGLNGMILIFFLGTFQGGECREGRASPFDNVPPAYQSISGHQGCLKLFQATDSHQQPCLPLSRPQGKALKPH